MAPIAAQLILALSAAPAPPEAPQGERILDVDLLPDGSVLVIHAGDGRMTRHDAATGAELDPFLTAEDLAGARSATVHEGTSTIAWFGLDDVVRIQALEGGLPAEGSEPATFPLAGPVRLGFWPRIEWTHDGQHLVTWGDPFFFASSNEPIRVWTREGENVWEGGAAQDLELHPTRNVIFAATSAGLLRGWPEEEGDARRHPAADGASPSESPPSGFHLVDLGAPVGAVGVSPDGTEIAVGLSRERDESPRLRAPHVLVRAAADGSALREASVRWIDRMGIKERVECLEYSPDGAFIGVSIGKGTAVGAVHADSLDIAWTGDFRGGRMNESFDVSWTGTGHLVSPWPVGWIADPRVEDDPLVELLWMFPEDTVTPPGAKEVIGIARLRGRDHLVRIDPATGDVLWAVPRAGMITKPSRRTDAEDAEDAGGR